MACMIDSDISEHIKKAAIDVFIELTGYQFDIDIDEENDEICLEFDHSDGLGTVAVRFTSTNVVLVVVILTSDRSVVQTRESKEYRYNENRDVNAGDIFATIQSYMRGQSIDRELPERAVIETGKFVVT